MLNVKIRHLTYLLILSFFSCNKEEPVSDKEFSFIISSCNQLNILENYFEDLESDDDNFITQIETRADCYIFNVKKSESFAVPISCIESINEVKNKYLTTLNLSNGNTITTAYGNIVESETSYSAFAKNPLSAKIKFESQVEGELSFRVFKKRTNQNDFSYTFNGSGFSFEKTILGLYFFHRNEVEITFTDTNQNQFVDTLIFNTPEVPDYIPNMRIVTAQPEKMEDGMTFVSYRGRDNPSTPFMVDEFGEVRYILDFINDPDLSNLNYDVGIERLKNGNFYFGKWLTNNLFEVDIDGIQINKWEMGPYEFHHNVYEKSDGNLLASVSRYDLHSSGRRAIEDWIVEIDRQNGNIVMAWDLKQSLNDARETYGVWIYSDLVDWAHVNAVIHDDSDNTIIVSCRTQGVVKLDYNNDVKWIMGPHIQWGVNGKGDYLDQYLLQPLDVRGQPIDNLSVINGTEEHPDFEWQWYQHAVKIMPNGHILLFDNGEFRNFGNGGQYSRAVEYKIDEENKTIQQIWQYGKERGAEGYSRIVSDADYLPGKNNVLFSPGSRVANSQGQIGGKIIEVDYDTKEVVFELEINRGGIVFHRAERMTLYPPGY